MKFIRCISIYVEAWVYAVFVFGLCVYMLLLGYKNDGGLQLEDWLICLVIFVIVESPMIVMIPKCYQTVTLSTESVCLGWWHVKTRTFKWSEVKEIGIAYTKAGYGTYKKFIYISKRPVTLEERFNILRVKDYKSFITIENRKNIADKVRTCSNLPIEPLPSLNLRS